MSSQFHGEHVCLYMTNTACINATLFIYYQLNDLLRLMRRGHVECTLLWKNPFLFLECPIYIFCLLCEID
jgi:hypothetical protein